MNFLQSRRRRHDGTERAWPGYMFGGHMRTSTLVLVLAFAAAWLVYNDHRESIRSSTPTQVPATQVVPPGFVPDPNYTWVPRSRVQAPPTTVTVTETPTTTTPPPTTTTTTTTTPPPLLPPIVLPPPFGPPTTTTPEPAPPASPTPAPLLPPAPPTPLLP